MGWLALIFILICEHTGLRGMYCYKVLCINLKSEGLSFAL